LLSPDESFLDSYAPAKREQGCPIITEPEANNCLSICTQVFCVFGTEFILISLIFLSVTSTKRLAAILQISVLLYSPVGEYNSFLQISVLLYSPVGEYNSLIRQI
jgi:hypothetical protein